MTPYQQAVAMGNVLEDDETDNIQYFDDYDAAVEAFAKHGRPKV